MKFSLNIMKENGCRLGALTELKSNPTFVYNTPLSIAITRGGSIPHLTQDTYHSNFSNDSILSIPAQHFVDQLEVIKSFKHGLSKFVSMPTHPLSMMVQDPCQVTQSGFNDQSSVSVFTVSGRVKLIPERYISLVKEIKPDWYEALNDADTKKDSSAKRIKKSCNNSFNFLEKCLNLHHSDEGFNQIGIFAPLLGGLNPKDRSDWSERIANKEVDGFSLLGLHSNGVSAESFEPSLLKKCVVTSLDKVPVDKIRQIHGAFPPSLILELVSCGVDVFDSSLSYLITERGGALCFPNTLERLTELEEDSKQLHMQNKRVKLDTDESQSLSKNGNEDRNNEVERPNYEINIHDERFAESQDPLIENCLCYTCKNFTKAYIHHLLNVKEMLATVLLMIHNLHHWDVFFDTIRSAIRTNQFDFLKNCFCNDK